MEIKLATGIGALLGLTVKLAGKVLALVMAYQLWGWKGTVFTLGLLMAN